MRLLGLVILAAALPTLHSTLSKSDKSKKAPTPKPKSAALPHKSQSTQVYQDVKLGYNEVLRNHHHIDYGEEKKFPHEILGYVTPKLDTVSPVWFQVVPKDNSAEHPACTINGNQDNDQGWLGDVRGNNSEISVVPRFIFEKWSGVQLRTLFTYEDKQNACADVLINFIRRNKFDGAVLEIWMSVMAMSQGLAGNDLINFLRNFGEIFRVNKLKLILPVPPPIDPKGERSVMFNGDHFRELANFVDAFQIMTYDYPAGRVGPVAPISWVRECMEHLLMARAGMQSKLLIGLNFYGYDYTPEGKMEPVVGHRFLELLKQHKSQLEWDKTAAEHFIRYDGHVVYYPSLASVEARLNLARDLGLGVAIWEMGQGLDYFYNLL